MLGLHKVQSNSRSQGISSHGIDIVFLAYIRSITRLLYSLRDIVMSLQTFWIRKIDDWSVSCLSTIPGEISQACTRKYQQGTSHVLSQPTVKGKWLKRSFEDMVEEIIWGYPRNSSKNAIKFIFESPSNPKGISKLWSYNIGNFPPKIHCTPQLYLTCTAGIGSVISDCLGEMRAVKFSQVCQA